MASPYHLALRGQLAILGKEPEGDSVQFIADSPALYQQLKRFYRLRRSQDGSVQLRLEGMDSPELHYGTAAQPLGEQARDALLDWMGFSDIVYSSDSSIRVERATPTRIPAVVLAQAAEANGRLVSYVIVRDGQGLPEDGEWTLVDKALLDRTLNARMVSEGLAYYTVYASTPAAHRGYLRQIAFDAREKKKGVWEADRTDQFMLEDASSISPGRNGQLVLPKLFRRCTDYLKARERGFVGNLADWIIDVSASASRDENDIVVIDDSIEVPLTDLLHQRNRWVAFNANLLQIAFIEK